MQEPSLKIYFCFSAVLKQPTILPFLCHKAAITCQLDSNKVSTSKLKPDSCKYLKLRQFKIQPLRISHTNARGTMFIGIPYTKILLSRHSKLNLIKYWGQSRPLHYNMVTHQRRPTKGWQKVVAKSKRRHKLQKRPPKTKHIVRGLEHIKSSIQPIGFPFQNYSPA